MTSFLLKQMKLTSKSAVAKLPTLNIIPSLFSSAIITVAISLTMSVAYAEQPLNDAELDAKYIDVKVVSVCVTEKVDEKNSEKKKNDTQETKQSCHDANNFVTVVTNKSEGTIGAVDNQPKDADNSALLASIFDNIRLLGGNEVLGVPTGVSNTGVPLMFGSENYSYKWSGNLSQIFQPVTLSGSSGIPPGTAFSVYDTSRLGYGFFNEAHFPDGLPQVTIQSIAAAPRN